MKYPHYVYTTVLAGYTQLIADVNETSKIMMRAELICGKCLMGLVDKGLDNLTDTDYILTPIAEITDNGKYQVTCDKGHNTEVTLDNLKFELLFELGLNAIIDGYYRDAVSSITASLVSCL